MGGDMRIAGTISRIAAAGTLFAGLGSVAIAAVPAGAAAKSGVSHASAGPGAWRSAAKFKGDLSAVDAVSATDAWAVGGALTLHWNGRAWSKVAAGPVATASLGSVKVFSRTNAWAVGSYCVASCSTNDATFGALVLHWNGAKWSRVVIPEPAGTVESALVGVAGVSPANLWAVGEYHTNAGAGTLAVHWNGTKWSRFAAPSPGADGQTYIYGMGAGSGTSAWAVGEYIDGSNADRTLMLHWNGKAWSKTTSPNPGGKNGVNRLEAVTTLSGANAWAVGTYCVRLCEGAPVNERTLVVHWNGKAWSKVTSPSPGKRGTFLDAASAVSGTVAWAAGMSCTPPTATARDTTCVPYILRWNGKKRATEATSVPRAAGENNLSGLAGLSAKNAWAVGSRCVTGCTGISPVDDTLLLHWNGKSWS